MKTFTVLVALVLAWPLAASEPYRCGGDGPKPLVDISPVFVTSTIPLPISDQVSDFVYLESREKLAFRSPTNDLNLMDLYTEEVSSLASVDLPLSRVAHPEDRFLTIKGRGAVLDIDQHKGWNIFSNRRLDHIFWSEDSLFSIEGKELSPISTRRNYLIQKFTPGQGSTTACLLTLPADGKVMLAEAQTYPNVFFAYQLPGKKDWAISFWQLNVSTCNVHPYAAAESFPGPLEKVIRFDALDATLVKIVHKEKNLRWSRGADCRYFHVGDGDVLPLRQDVPVVALWSKKQGLNLVYLDQEKRARILDKLPILGVKADDLALSTSGAKLFFRPALPASWSTSLLRIDLISKVCGPGGCLK